MASIFQRVSLGKSGRKSLNPLSGSGLTLRRLGSASRHEHVLEAEENPLVSWRGISLAFLKEMMNLVNSEELAPDVELVQCVEPFDLEEEDEDTKFTLGLKVGDTVRVLDKVEEDMWKGSIAFKGGGFFPSDKVRRKRRDEWTTEDVCEYIVKPRARQTRTPWLDDIFTDFVSKAEYKGVAYVVHARNANFMDLIQALEHEFAGRDPNKQFFWIDIFCANQLLISDEERREDDNVRESLIPLLSSGIHDAMGEFEKCCVVFDDWKRPSAVSRLWCIWEMYAITKHYKHLQICLTETKTKELRGAILEDFKGPMGEFSSIRIDIKDAGFAFNSDRMTIHNAILQTVGFDQVNQSVETELQIWLGRFATDTLTSLQFVHVSSRPLPEVINNVGRDLGNFLITMKDFEAANEVYNTVLESGNPEPGIAEILLTGGWAMGLWYRESTGTLLDKDRAKIKNEGKKYFNEAIKILKDNELMEELANAVDRFAEFYETVDSPKDAAKKRKEAAKIRDRI